MVHFKLVPAVVAVGCLIGCAPVPEGRPYPQGKAPAAPRSAQGAKPGDWLKFSDSPLGFSVSYPSDWQLAKPQEAFVHFVAYAQDGSADCAVTLKPHPETANLDQKEINAAMLSDNPKNIARRLFAREDVTISGGSQIEMRGVACISAEIEAQWEGPNGQNWRYQWSHALFTPGRAWGLHCGVTTLSKQDTQASFSRMLPVFMRVLESLELPAR